MRRFLFTPIYSSDHPTDAFAFYSSNSRALARWRCRSHISRCTRPASVMTACLDSCDIFEASSNTAIALSARYAAASAAIRACLFCAASAFTISERAVCLCWKAVATLAFIKAMNASCDIANPFSPPLLELANAKINFYATNRVLDGCMVSLTVDNIFSLWSFAVTSSKCSVPSLS